MFAIKAKGIEVYWAVFGVMALWTLGGLFLYCLASELVRLLGSDTFKESPLLAWSHVHDQMVWLSKAGEPNP